MPSYSLETLQSMVGKELGVSRWFTLDQARIETFADCTEDHQWIHVDEARAAQSPLGSTIAHGFLSLSLLSAIHADVGTIPEGVKQVFNYGSDKVRFISPVKSGSRVRGRVGLLEVQDKGEGRLLIKMANTVEIEGEEKPALIAETLAMLFT